MWHVGTDSKHQWKNSQRIITLTNVVLFYCYSRVPLFNIAGMEANGGEIVRELKELRLQKAEIEQRISALEAKLHETAAVERCDAVSNGCSVIEHGLEHGMSPDQIYRYSRQLLLPSFGVEGTTLLLNTQMHLVNT